MLKLTFWAIFWIFLLGVHEIWFTLYTQIRGTFSSMLIMELREPYFHARFDPKKHHKIIRVWVIF